MVAVAEAADEFRDWASSLAQIEEDSEVLMGLMVKNCVWVSSLSSNV
jgi:hypothetical protein